jgi:hypothetical protein
MRRKLLEAAGPANPNPKLDRLAADLAVFDLRVVPSRQIHRNTVVLAAVRALHGHEVAKRGVGRNGAGLEHGLEPIRRIDRLGVGC